MEDNKKSWKNIYPWSQSLTKKVGSVLEKDFARPSPPKILQNSNRISKSCRSILRFCTILDWEGRGGVQNHLLEKSAIFILMILNIPASLDFFRGEYFTKNPDILIEKNAASCPFSSVYSYYCILSK